MKRRKLELIPEQALVFETPSADLKTTSAAIEMLRAPKRLLELEFLIAARQGESLKMAQGPRT